MTKCLQGMSAHSPLAQQRRRRYLASLECGPVFESVEPRWLLSALVVTTAADSGAGSLRQAILDANTSVDGDTISFNIAGGGAHTISLLTNLPAIAAGKGAVVLDATTQPGYAGTPLIAINGNGGAGNGLILFAGGSTIKGLAIQNFASRGIFIGSNGGNTIEGNYIGTDLTGTLDMGNGLDGILVNGVGGNTIKNNVISGNNDEGIEFNLGATGNTVQNNIIGLSADGLADLGNANSGITFNAAGNDNNDVLGNIISGNGLAGISIGSSNITIQGNKIGTNAAGTAGIANGEDGIAIASGASDNIIGGQASGEGNIIAFNARNGVRVLAGTRNTISGNSIFSNGTLGIDLIPVSAGVTPNDATDSDTGPNGLQNYPEIFTAASNGISTQITGSLTSIANATYTIEFFSSPSADPTGFGEGRTYLGAITVNTGATGTVGFNASVAGSVIGHYITSTATDSNGSTSEFSGQLGGPPAVTPSNLAPTADAGGPYTVNEGGTVTLDASGSSDPEQGDTGLLYHWDFNGDSIFDDAEGMNPTFSAALLDGAAGSTVTVAVQVTDNGMLTSIDTAMITIDNVAPVAGAVTGPVEAVRGQTLSYASSFTDAGIDDTHNTQWQITDSSNVIVATGTGLSVEFAPVTLGTFTVTFTVTDDDGGSDSSSLDVTISESLLTLDPVTGELTLLIGGGDSSETIVVKDSNMSDTVKVTINDRDADIRTVGYVGPAAIERIVILGNGGNDWIRVAGNVGNVAAEIYGGDGNDLLVGGGGNDIVVGGNGDDTLWGHGGRDILIGGMGRDLILGAQDDDILVGGATLYDSHRAALNALMAEWASANTYATRITNLTNGTGLNGAFVFNNTTVFDDSVRDILLGLQGSDWFLLNVDEDHDDAKASELLTDIEIDFALAP